MEQHSDGDKRPQPRAFMLTYWSVVGPNLRNEKRSRELRRKDLLVEALESNTRSVLDQAH